MNLLSLVQRLALECGVSGTIASTVGLEGSQARLVTWVNQAWTEIQTKHDDWDFLRSSNILGLGASFTTVAGQSSYPLGTGAGTCGVPASGFGKWDTETFRDYTTTVGYRNETHLDWIPYDVWRNSYMFGAMRSVQTRPVAFSVGPDKSICLGPPPNDQYTITGDYFIAPTSMSSDTDTPTGLPERFHMLIVYGAMMMYAGYESAPEVWQRGSQQYRKVMSELEAQYVPEICFSGALA
jgi:hypothetical protein